jgi:hypothetical protein
VAGRPKVPRKPSLGGQFFARFLWRKSCRLNRIGVRDRVFSCLDPNMSASHPRSCAFGVGTRRPCKPCHAF